MMMKVSDAAKRIPVRLGDEIAKYGSIILASGIGGWVLHAASARLMCYWGF